MDDTKILMLTQGEVLGANLFAYCNNNPVMYSDPSGYLAAQILGAITGAVAGALIEVITQSFSYFLKHGSLNSFKINKGKVAWAALWGGLSGAFSMTKYKRFGQTIVNGIIGMVSSIVDAKTSKKKVDLGTVISGFLFGAVGGLVSGAGFGAEHYQKCIFGKGGYYLINGVAHRSLPIFQKELFKSYARSLSGYAKDVILSLIQSKI